MKQLITHYELMIAKVSKGLKWYIFLVWIFQFSACAKTPKTDFNNHRNVGPPNIVLIIAYDMGWGDMSAHGNTNLFTPNLDRLAKEGRSYPNFYVSAVCSPTRAELLTGRHALEVGVTGTGAGRERINLGVELLPEVLAKAGYKNGLFGKWHNGTQAPYHPLCRGFDEFYGFTSGHWGSYFDYFIEDNDSISRFKGFLPDVITEKAISFIGEHAEMPTFTMLTFPTPHSPMQVPDKWFDPFTQSLDSLGNGQGEEDERFTKAALAMVENLDWNVGRLLASLDSLSLTQNTLVIFLSDNGPNNWRWNGGMRGRKGSVDEGGVRSPLLMKWPQGLAQILDYSSVSVRDLFPTILNLIELESLQPLGLVGRDIQGEVLALEKANQKHPLTSRDLSNFHVKVPPIINQWRDKVSVRFLSHLLDENGNLYLIDTDRGQNEPILDRKELQADLQRFADRFRDSIMVPNLQPDTRPFTVGHPRLQRTFLPARDAVQMGALSRSNRWPNDSYFDRWEGEDASINWNVDIIESGRFKVSLYYTLADECSGTKVIFNSQGKQIESAPLLGHFPGVSGQENDRVLREESYVKNWKKASIGQVDLLEGIDTFSLSAQLLPGRSGPEVWAIELQRIESR